MALPRSEYFNVLVETYYTGSVSGLHGPVHVRPVDGQGIDTAMRVECSKEMRDPERFKLGSMFIVTAKYSKRRGGIDFLKAPYDWKYLPVSRAGAFRKLENLRAAGLLASDSEAR